MKPIKNVTIIGMGALGTLFGYEIQSKIGRENVAFLMDEARCEKNKTAVYKVNGEPFDFRIISPKEAAPADLINLDVMGRKLEIIGVKGERRTPEEIDEILAERRKAWKPKPVKYKTGVLRLFSELAASPMKGAYIDFDGE